MRASPCSRPTIQAHPEEAMIRTNRTTAAALAAAAALGSGVFLSAGSADARQVPQHAKPVQVEVFAPEQGHNAGIAGTGWFVDMQVHFKSAGLASAGFSGLQLTEIGRAHV